MKKKLMWGEMSAKDKKEAFAASEEYKEFLSEVKTEREAVDRIIAVAKKNDFIPYEKVKKPKPGTKFYVTHKGKVAGLVILGKNDPSRGVRMVVSHIDSPRLDLKQNPLYEDRDTKIALFKTHYYGGIKKYQWANIPLAIHGVVFTKSGKRIDVNVGEDPADPVFVVGDLLPHLARGEQSKRTMREVIKGEELNIIVCNTPVDDEDAKKKVKLWVLDYLNKKCDMVEEDFTSAELEAVPAGPARDIGFDRSMVGGYGQDDRICGWTCLKSMISIGIPKTTSIGLFFDKEEVGSQGATGAQSRFPEQIVGDILALYDPEY
ncbi:MAG: aminopeptidase, partial [Thermoplasmata archaeon]|nr:aminopeptidase [Thermoplasmata archaeon]